jgi:Surface-adhesin protein E
VRSLFVSLALFIFLLSATAQTPSEWERVHTFDDSFIEMNSSLLTHISRDVWRVRFRWTFIQPQALSELQYQSKLEVMELNCAEKRARTFHVTLLNSQGGIVHVDDTPGEWRVASASGMLQKMFVAGCDLVKSKTPKTDAERSKLELERVGKYAYEVAQQLEQTKDFEPIINRFFVNNYLTRYLEDENTNWFPVLDRVTARKATPQELQRFYVAFMNAGYVSSLYLIERAPSDFPERASLEEFKKIVTPDVWELIANHPYTIAHKKTGYDFLGEKIEDLEQLRGYTNLLEQMVTLMRKHVSRTAVEQSEQYREIAATWELYEPKVRSCKEGYLGLPGGTKLFEVDIPLFHLQIAETSGQLRVVSANYRFK